MGSSETIHPSVLLFLYTQSTLCTTSEAVLRIRTFLAGSGSDPIVLFLNKSREIVINYILIYVISHEYCKTDKTRRDSSKACSREEETNNITNIKQPVKKLFSFSENLELNC